MSTSRLKLAYFGLTALNTYASTCFFYYLVFLLRDRFAFGDRENLWLTALHGFVYVFAAWQCGKFAQRRGVFTSLKVGFGALTALMVAGALLNSATAILCLIVFYSIALLFTWPALESLVSENETQAGVQHMVGVYNCTWATAAAIAYFTGGRLYDWLGAGAVFWLPGAIFLLQFLSIFWLERQAARNKWAPAKAVTPEPHHPEAAAFQQKIKPETFLKMAWLANPFAYVAINTLFAVMPGVAAKFKLSPTEVGLICSIWLFARLGAFVLLWRWTGWHYRFRWLLSSFVVLIAGFMLMLLASQLWLVIVAQVFFGFATGLIYYSSLFYSMDVGDASAEHGGLHEAAIGAGVFVGPGIGAAALQFGPGLLESMPDNLRPDTASLATFAVSGLLLCGLAGLIWLRTRK